MTKRMTNKLSIYIYIMTDNSSNFDNLQEKNKQVLNNISQLQKQEQFLYSSLDNASLTIEQKKQIIDEINQISQMRKNMYDSLNDMYSIYKNNTSASSSTLIQQMQAIDILENELNQEKKRLNLLEDEKNNKLRSVQINTYYGKRYNAHSQLMKTIVITCIPLIILAVLANKGFLPANIYVFISGLVLVIGLIILGYQLIDLSNRSDMNWDEYNWHFDQEGAKKNAIAENIDDKKNKNNPWKTMSTTCIGSACCYKGSTYDDKNNICVPNDIYKHKNG